LCNQRCLFKGESMIAFYPHWLVILMSSNISFHFFISFFHNRHSLMGMHLIFWWRNGWLWTQLILWCCRFGAHFQPMKLTHRVRKDVGRMHLLTLINELFFCNNLRKLWTFINNFLLLLLLNHMHFWTINRYVFVQN